MISSRLGINLVFGFVVALLALTAAVALYENSHPADNQPAQPAAPAAAKKMAELKRLAGQDPQNSYYPAQIGDIYFDMRQFDNAADYYQRSLTIHPQDPNIETDLATCYHYLGRHDKALEILDNVLQYSPGFSQAMFNKGIVLAYGKGNEKDGIAVWEDLLRADPNSPRKAEIEQKIGQLKGSVK
jgi:tetratricopeptide (TPR) repeat protein